MTIDPALYRTIYSGVLRDIFDAVPISPSDVLVDIGCGEGLVIQHWLDRGLRNRMIGIEIDWALWSKTRQRFADKPNVEIIAGDAIRPPIGTLYYVFNPFIGETMQRFELALRGRPVRIVYNATQEQELKMFKHWKVETIVPPVEGRFRAVLIKHRYAGAT